MYREVTMIEVTEVLRLWRDGVPTKRLAAQLGLAPKTVRRYVEVASAHGLRVDGPPPTDEDLREVLSPCIRPAAGREGMAGPSAPRIAPRSRSGSRRASDSPRSGSYWGARVSCWRIPCCIASRSRS
jgi:hypothetical protein